MTIAEIHDKLKNRRATAVEITKHYLDRIKKIDPQLNSFITVSEKEALKQAEKADALIGDADNINALFIKYPLLGVPVAFKDIYSTKDIQTTAASNILKGYIPPYDATAVAKLKKAGAITLGKLNCDAFAHGGSGM